jgi:hypothetical protein
VLQNWLNLNGGGTVSIVPPGVVSDPWVPVDPEDYQLVFLSLAGESIAQVITQQDIDEYPVFHQPDVDCLYTIQGINADLPWLLSIIIDGTELVTDPIDQSTDEGKAAIAALIAEYLALNGGGYVDFGSDFFVAENCFNSFTMTFGDLVPSTQQCDYIYEFCDTYACISRLVNQWLCLNPCPKPCGTSNSEEQLHYQEARKRAVELSTLFFHALMPLVATDRLWYLGNWDISENRLCNINNIIDLFKKLRDYVKQCGFDCCDPCKDCGGCNGCGDPCTQGNYVSTSPNPCNCK